MDLMTVPLLQRLAGALYLQILDEDYGIAIRQHIAGGVAHD